MYTQKKKQKTVQLSSKESYTAFKNFAVRILCGLRKFTNNHKVTKMNFKINSFVLIIALFTSLFLFNACEEEIIETDPKSLTFDEKYDNYIFSAAVGLLELSKNPIFRKAVNTKVMEQFDDDYNTLLANLNGFTNGLGIDLKIDLDASIDIHSYLDDKSDYSLYKGAAAMEEIVNGFTYYDEKAFIQIYIPFVEEKGGIDDYEQPIIVLGMEDEDIADGIVLLPNGDFGIIPVDEAMARNQLVWVISMNESIDNDADLAFYLSGQRTGENTQQKTVVGGKAFMLYKIYITDKKEKWINGKGDLSWFGAQFEELNYCDAMIQATENFRKVKNNELENWINVNEYFASELSPITALTDTESFDLVIYEKDKKKKYERTEVLEQNFGCTECEAEATAIYRSKETPYGSFICGAKHADLTESFSWEDYTGDFGDGDGGSFKFQAKREY